MTRLYKALGGGWADKSSQSDQTTIGYKLAINNNAIMMLNILNLMSLVKKRLSCCPNTVQIPTEGKLIMPNITPTNRIDSIFFRGRINADCG